MKEERCNGWKNCQTWSCALWIDNTEHLYFAARDFMRTIPKGVAIHPYYSFIHFMGMENEKNGDGYKWLSTRIDYKEMNAYMRDLAK